jgi:hypothetical protein
MVPTVPVFYETLTVGEIQASPDGSLSAILTNGFRSAGPSRSQCWHR